MNFIDKAKQESKSQAELARKVKALIEKATGQQWTDGSIKALLKMYDKGHAGTIHEINHVMQGALDEQERQASINYLMAHMPLDGLDNEIVSIQDNIEEWADKVKKNPSHHLSWGADVFKLAAKLDMLQTVRHWLADVSRYDEPGFWENQDKNITKHVLQSASNMPSSTSATSNLMDSRLIEAWAEAASSFWDGVGTVRRWFHEKDRLGINVQEELDKRKIDVQALGKILLAN